MKISKDYPPNYDDIKKFFSPIKGTLFTYGDTIYNPDNAPIDEPLIKHEEVHERQQEEIGVEYWWKRYYIDKNFRASQEIEAHQVQYAEAKKHFNDKNLLAKFLDALAKQLSGELYGNVMSYSDALKAIKTVEPIRFKINI